MPSSLFTALSSLQAHQGWIDVIGNNLANASTPGYKGSRMTFASLFSQTLRGASGPNGGLGGRNPVQIGGGVGIGSIDRSFTQGVLESTGRAFDMALRGSGFFALSSGASSFYTRVGSFGLDAASNLVDSRTGYRVLGPGGQPVELDVDGLFPPQATSELELAGNLPKEVTGPLAEVLTGNEGLADGAPAVLTGTQAGPFSVPVGQTFSMTVNVSGEGAQLVTVPGSAAPITAADIAAAIDALEGVGATVDGSGFVEVSSDRTGEDVALEVVPGPAGADLAGLLGLPTVQVTGSEGPVSATTDLNDLPGNVVDYVAGDSIRVSGVDADGSPINASFVYGTDGTTVDDFVAFVDGLYADASVTLDAEGRIVVTAQTPGEASLTLSISDAAGQTGSTDWPLYATSVTTEGAGPDRVVTSTEVFDSAGLAHPMTLTFERQADGSWTLTPELDAEDGAVLSAPITGILFADDGAPQGLGGVLQTVQVQFAGQSSAQSLELDLGTDGELDGLTQLGGDATAWVSNRDGHAVGSLAELSVDRDGTIVGSYTNGRSQSLGAVGVARFDNPEGLAEFGDNLWIPTVNSGDPILGAGNTGGSAEVIGSNLEGSNVDTATQFVHLIEAQRGYQASARVISAQDELLAEAVNLI